ncbi:MAG: response regulator [Flavobacterium sp.]|jgi:CheY-like chemotaxis protein
MGINTLSILLIEDDVIEIMKFNRVIKTLNLNHKIKEVNNGEEALEVLNKKIDLPDLILLDLNMPKLNGIDFLKILKNDEVLKYIPTVILSTSSNLVDVKQCYEIGIAGYIIKPLKYEDYKDKIFKLINYWEINELYR